MKLVAWIASRYLLSSKAGRYARLLTVTAVASIAIGMLSLILVMSVMRGFRKELTDRMLGFNAHVIIKKNYGTENISHEQIEGLLSGIKVRDIAPFVTGETIVQSNASGELLAQGAKVRGIDVQKPGVLGSVETYFPEGEGFDSLARRRDSRETPSAVIGNEVAIQLSVHPDFGDKIALVAPLAEILPNGELGPNRANFKIAGVFKSGIFEYDSKYVLLSIDDARKLLGEQAQEGWQIRLEEPSMAPKAVKSISPHLPAGISAEGWDKQNRKLFAALKLERIAMGGVLFMALSIASFTIVGVIMLVTASKRKDIAILESIGLSNSAIGRIFLMHAAFIGAIGSATGLAGGLALCFALKRWPIRLPQSYYLDWLPVEINPYAAVLFALAGVAVAVAASIYPVKQATRTSPVEVLRYE